MEYNDTNTTIYFNKENNTIFLENVNDCPEEMIYLNLETGECK